MARIYLESIILEQSENKKVWGLFRADPRPIQSIGFVGKIFHPILFRNFLSFPVKNVYLKEHFHNELHQL